MRCGVELKSFDVSINPILPLLFHTGMYGSGGRSISRVWVNWSRLCSFMRQPTTTTA